MPTSLLKRARGGDEDELVDSWLFLSSSTKKGRLKTCFQTTFSSLASVSVKQSDRMQPRQSVTTRNGSHTLFQ